MQRNNPNLTPTEAITAQLVAEGMSNREIGARIYCTAGTVANVVSSCLSKLHLPNRAALAVWAIQQDTTPTQSASNNSPYNPDDYRELLVIAYYAQVIP